MRKILILLFASFFSIHANAFPCYITLVKDSCWTKYNVTVDVFDASNDSKMATVIVPSGTSWARETFACEPKQKIRFMAQFTPVFWESDRGKSYDVKNFKSLPDQVAQGDTAWNIAVCYPSDFSEVPFPPDGTDNCSCDMANIPLIKP